MKKTLQINLGGLPFTIEEDAYQKLSEYLQTLKNYFASYEGSTEIVQDIEARIAEKFFMKKEGFIEIQDVSKIISEMGTVSDFAEENEEPLTLQETRENTTKASPLITGFYRDANAKALGGVLSGIAHKYRFDVVWARLLFVVLAFGLISEGVGPVLILLYLIAWAALPVRNDLSDHKTVKKFYRDSQDKVIGGVASGLAHYLNMDVKLARLIFVISGFMGIGIIFYILLWIIAPTTKTVTDKLQQEGKPVTIQNIEESVKVTRDGESVKKENILTKILLFPFRIIGVILNFIGQLVGPFGKLLKILFGIIILITGISLAFAAVVGIAAFFGFLNSAEWVQTGNVQFNSLLNEISPLGGIFAFFIMFVPGLALLISGIILIIGKPLGDRNFWMILLVLWLTGIIGTTVIGSKYSLNFTNNGSTVENQSISFPTDRILVLDIADDFKTTNTKSWPEINLTTGQSGKVGIEIQKTANGVNAKAANRYAENIIYDIQQKSDTLLFDKYISIKEGEPYRNQEVEVTLALPADLKFKPTQRFLERFYSIQEIKKAENFSISNTGEEVFYIDHEGLLHCFNCQNIDPYDQIESEFEEESFKNFDNFNDLSVDKLIPIESSIQNIEIKGNYDVLFTKGDSTSIKLFSDNEDAISNTKTNIIEGKLKIGYIDPFNKNHDKVKLKITLPNFVSITLTDGVTLKAYGFNAVNTGKVILEDGSVAAIQLQAKQLNSTLENNSRLLLDGEIENMTVQLKDQSYIKAPSIKVQNINGNISNASILELRSAEKKNLNTDKSSAIKFKP